MTAARSRLRFAVPVAAAALAVGIGLGGSGALSAGADPGLPPVTAQQLLVDLQEPTTTSYSGTVSTSTDLGIPAALLADAGDLAGLLAGDGTLRVWADGPTRQRLAVLVDGAETDVVRNGDDLWLWSSSKNAAAHSTIDSDDQGTRRSVTPPELATELLDSIEPSTAVTTSGTGTAAGRDVYELTLRPRTSDTLVGQVDLAIDAQTHLPLRVSVYARGATDQAVEVGFSHISYDRPAASLFAFTPPAGAEVKEVTPPTDAGRDGKTSADKPTVVGSGWAAVAVTQLDPATVGSAGGLLDALPTVSGAWGSGHVLQGTLFTAVVTDDGRLAIGAVPVEQVTRALATS